MPHWVPDTLLCFNAVSKFDLSNFTGHVELARKTLFKTMVMEVQGSPHHCNKAGEFLSPG